MPDIQSLHKVHGIVILVLSLILIIKYRRTEQKWNHMRYWIYALVTWSAWYLMKGYLGFLAGPMKYPLSQIDYSFNNVNSLFIFLATDELNNAYKNTRDSKPKLSEGLTVISLIILAIAFTILLSMLLHFSFANHPMHDSLLALPTAIVSFLILLYFTFNYLSKLNHRRTSNIIFFIFSVYSGLQLVYFHFFFENYPPILTSSLFLMAICLKVICSLLVFFSDKYLTPVST